MITRQVRIGSQAGLHARPATILVQTVQRSGAVVTIAREGEEPVRADSVLSLMTAGIRYGELVTLSAEDDNGPVLDELAALLREDLDQHSQAEN